MSDPVPPSIWERSTLVRFFRWLFSWRGIRTVLIALAWIATIIALLYGEENWRGRRAWNKYRRDLEVRGEQLDYKAFIPPPVPDEQNFAATPFVKAWFIRKNWGDGDRELWGDDYSRIHAWPNSGKKKETRQFMNLVGWARSFELARLGEFDKKTAPERPPRPEDLELPARAKAAPAVLEGLKSSEPRLEELRAASQRPYSVYPVNYDLNNPWGILLPHLAKIKATCTRLQIKACAELALAQSDKALGDVRLMLYLADSVKSEPILISYLVRLACLQIAIQPVWEGLAEHRWSDAHLQVLQKQFEQYDFVRDLKFPLDGERAAGILTADLLYKRKYHLSELVEEPNSASLGAQAANLFARIAPHGWYHLEQRNYARLYETMLAGTFEPQKRRVFPKQSEANGKELQRQIAGGSIGKTLNGLLHHQLIAALLLPSLEGLPRRAATGQTAADEAVLACALERYRLANGKFPARLDALAPRSISQLPKDAITGDPYKYRLTDDGQFVLYSVGWNGADDGGTPGKVLFDDKFGDWVWEYPRE